MLSLTKRSEAQPAEAQRWHTNFRDFERLPDTKVVRTTFFINTAAVAVTIGLLLWLGYREYHIYSLKDQIADAQKQIDGNSKQNKEALRLSKIFTDEQQKLAEAAAFRYYPISPTEFVTLLGQTLPKEISIESMDGRVGDPSTGSINVRGVVAGTPDQASGVASKYVDILRANRKLGSVFDPITLTNLNRDPRNGFLSFEIVFKVKSAATGKK